MAVKDPTKHAASSREYRKRRAGKVKCAAYSKAYMADPVKRAAVKAQRLAAKSDPVIQAKRIARETALADAYYASAGAHRRAAWDAEHGFGPKHEE